MIPSVSILQISDLHRERLSPIRNDVLLNSLENDRTRYATGRDSAPIRSPDIIVVSGDIIRGVPPGTDDYEAKLGQQHQEALQFLTALTDRLLGGDRKRLVLVPGNHDVSACHFIRASNPSSWLPTARTSSCLSCSTRLKTALVVARLRTVQGRKPG